MSSTVTPFRPTRKALLVLAACLGAVLLLFFWKSFQPGEALFSNDGPLAAQKAAPFKMPGAFFGIWNNLYWLGSDAGSFTPNITGLELLLLGPTGYTNFHAPIALALLGLCSWLFFQQLRLNAFACLLAALAAALNMNFVSNTGWGLSSRALSLAMAFLALAAVESSFRGRAFIKIILAGLATGMSVSEGGDNGAIFSLFIAAFAFVRSWVEDGAIGGRVGKGLGRVAVMAACAAVLSAQTLNIFVDVAVKGNVNATQKPLTPEEQWDWATQWSLPKKETLRVIIPGIYGYKMDTPDGGQYWGGVGRDARWVPEFGTNGARSSGAGEYAGVLVVLLVLWALGQSFRSMGSPYTKTERRMIWFWAAAALIALGLAWGRYAPFYRVVFSMPYFSSVRNAMKFMHPFHLCLMVLFAFGLQGLWRRYVEVAGARANSLGTQLKTWWAKAPAFDKRWTLAAVGTLALSILIFLIYSSSQASLAKDLGKIGFDETQAKEIAAFSAREVGLFVLYFAVALGSVLVIQSGFLSGTRGKWAALLLGLVLVTDLVRADVPWIRYYNYEKRYITNPVLDVLKEKPGEERVTVFPAFRGAPQTLSIINSVFQAEWLQHQFLYYSIESINVAQEPRMPADKAAFMAAIGNDMYRYWRLTNTRYILGISGRDGSPNPPPPGPDPFVTLLNQQLAPQDQPFVSRLNFELSQDENNFIGAVANPNGRFALIELTNALPRAKLYTHWQVSTNDQETIKTIGNPGFDPAATVLISDPIAASPAGTNGATNPGTVTFLRSSSRQIELRADAAHPSVLLFNSRYNPAWNVFVDGAPRPLLRCNFIMRGVEVPAGQHTITFKYQPRITTFYVTLGSVIVGLLLCGLLVVTKDKDQPAREKTAAAPAPRDPPAPVAPKTKKA